MTSSTTSKCADLNLLWAKLLIEELHRLGVRHVCMAPGSRSTPLTLAAAGHEGIERHVHFDERGLGFMALGLAKATATPVAIVTTSGTAVANLYPAVIEANQTNVPLIVLSGDRPPELIDCGANQAIIQPAIFADYAERLDLPTPDLAIAPQVLLARLGLAVTDLSRPLHINCMYREPLYPDGQRTDFSDYLQPIADWRRSDKPWSSGPAVISKALPSPEQVAEFAKGRGVIVVGSLAEVEQPKALVELAERLGWPILADAQSQMRQSPGVVHHFDQLLHNTEAKAQLAQAENLLLIGGRLLSKRLLSFIAEHEWSAFWQWQPLRENLDPNHRAKLSLVGSIDDLVSLDWPSNGDANWVETLYEVNESLEAHYQDKFKGQQLTEMTAMRTLSEVLSAEQALFIGNSLPIRLFDMVASPEEQAVPIYTNRGASGIDGLLATSCGVAAGLNRPTVLAIGDLSLLHDLNSLTIARGLKVPLVIVVLNNDGGSIFNLLPVPNEQLRQEFYRTSHGVQFESAAAQFGLSYYRPADVNELKAAIESGVSGSGATLIEVVVPPNESAEDILALASEVKQLHGAP